MDYEVFWNDLLEEAKRDKEYQRHLEMVQSAEAGYLAVCEALSPVQRQAVEDYISACEAQDDYLIALAYRLGKRDR